MVNHLNFTIVDCATFTKNASLAVPTIHNLETQCSEDPYLSELKSVIHGLSRKEMSNSYAQPHTKTVMAIKAPAYNL